MTKLLRKPAIFLILSLSSDLSLARGVFFSSVSAEPIYRHVDASGKITYSTEPSKNGDAPVKLPEIKRIANTPASLSTPETCEKRGGIDCSKGADTDGGVICLDGSRRSAEQFNQFCLDVRLSVTKPTLTDRAGRSFQPRSVTEMEQLGEVRITVRNLHSIPAKGVRAEIRFPRPHGTLPLQGPAQIDGFGLAEYSADLKSARTIYLQKFLQLKPVVQCENCQIVLGSR